MNPILLSSPLLSVYGALSEIPIVYKDKERSQGFRRICELSQQVMGSQACSLVLVDLHERQLEHAASVGFDDAYEEHMRNRRMVMGSPLNGDALDYALLARGEVIEATGLGEDGQGIANPETARHYGLHAALCVPLFAGDKLIGYLNHFTGNATGFPPDKREVLAAFARHASTVVQILGTLARATSHQKLAQLNKEMLEATSIRDVDQLLIRILDIGLKLTRCRRGTISRLNPVTGGLDITAHQGESPPRRTSLLPGQGITWQALNKGEPILANNVRDEQWKDIYVPLWPDTAAELAVPIVVDNAEIRWGEKTQRVAKPIGVFNVESVSLNAFSVSDQDLLVSLARYAGLLIDRLELDRKLAQLDKIRLDMVGLRDWKTIFERMIQTITDTLGYDYVNISLVDREEQRIRTEYITGIPKDQVEAFKRMADHPLNGPDIQADICCRRQIEVPAVDDPRFDPQVYGSFNHERLVRVYLPMIDPSNEVLGTVETGYRRRPHREHIYEQDVQILKGFVDYTARALEQIPHSLLDQITHELRSPIVGMRNNASFLQRRMAQLPEDLIDRKFNDIQADCDILLHQVEELEYLLGGQRRSSKRQRVLVFRDVIIKTVRQLKPLMIDQGMDPNRVDWEADAIRRIKPLYVNRAQLNQVVYNLLINAIKYSDENPDRFWLKIDTRQTAHDFVISFRDWGMGIKPEYVNQVFDEGLRTPEVIERDVNGSGLGLTIARRIMREMGGDLRLVAWYKPTEFQVILPKKLMENPDDSHD